MSEGHQVQKIRMLGTDALRLIAIFAVVCIHAFGYSGVSESETGDAIMITSRFGVPFFFIAGGFFMGRSVSRSTLRQCLRISTRLSVIWLFWMAVYIFISYWLSKQILPFWDPSILVKLVLQGFTAYHLWFIPSLIFSSVAVLMTRRILPWPVCLVLAGVSYAVGVLLIDYLRFPDPYSHTTVASAERSAFGFALVMVGYWLSRLKTLPDFKVSLGLLVAGACGQFAEVYVVHVVSSVPVVEIEFVFSTAVFAAGAFLVSLQLNFETMPLVVRLSSRYVLGIYCVHLIFVQVLMTYANIEPTVPNLMLVAVLAFFLSAVTAVLLGLVKPLRQLVHA